MIYHRACTPGLHPIFPIACKKIIFSDYLTIGCAIWSNGITMTLSDSLKNKVSWLSTWFHAIEHGVEVRKAIQCVNAELDDINSLTSLADGWDWREAYDDYRVSLPLGDTYCHWLQLLEVAHRSPDINWFWN